MRSNNETTLLTHASSHCILGRRGIDKVKCHGLAIAVYVSEVMLYLFKVEYWHFRFDSDLRSEDLVIGPSIFSFVALAM
jgi:hypothetical protein